MRHLFMKTFFVLLILRLGIQLYLALLRDWIANYFEAYLNTTLGQYEEMTKFWWFWPYFQGHMGCEFSKEQVPIRIFYATKEKYSFFS